MKKKLAIICANLEQLPLVKKAKEMGNETHCFAWDKEGYTQCRGIADYFHPISIVEKEKILEKCKEIRIDGVTSIFNDFAVPTVAYVAENMGLIGNRYEDALIAGNKYKARQAYLKNGVNSPRFAISTEGQLPDLNGFQYPLIVKPADGRASIGVMKVNSEKELQYALVRAQKESYIGQVIIEEFVSGFEVSVDSISYNGKHYIFAIRDKVTSGAPYYVEIAHHVPSNLSAESIAKIEAEARKALDSLNFKYGSTDSEFIITEDGKVYVVEVNARMGGDQSSDLIKYSTGYDYMKLHVNAALGFWEEPVIIHQYHTGVYFWCEGREWVKQMIDNKNKYPEIVETEILKEDLTPLQSSVDRSGYFIYKSDRKRTWYGY